MIGILAFLLYDIVWCNGILGVKLLMGDLPLGFICFGHICFILSSCCHVSFLLSHTSLENWLNDPHFSFSLFHGHFMVHLIVQLLCQRNEYHCFTQTSIPPLQPP